MFLLTTIFYVYLLTTPSRLYIGGITENVAFSE